MDSTVLAGNCRSRERLYCRDIGCSVFQSIALAPSVAPRAEKTDGLAEVGRVAELKGIVKPNGFGGEGMLNRATKGGVPETPLVSGAPKEETSYSSEAPPRSEVFPSPLMSQAKPRRGPKLR